MAGRPGSCSSRLCCLAVVVLAGALVAGYFLTLPGGVTRGRPVETREATIDAGGGELGLPSGARLVFPADAVPGPCTVRLARLDSAGDAGEEGLREVVLEATATAKEFAREVELRVPFPAGVPASADGALAGIQDEHGGLVMVPTRVERTADGRAELVVPTRHFCVFVLDWLLSDTPPPSAPVLEVPIYKQGPTKFCWAATLHALTRAAGGPKAGTPWELVGRVGQAPGQTGNWQLRWSSEIEAIVRERVTIPPRRRYWDSAITNTPLLGALKRYVRTRIAAGLPVVLASQPKDHLYLLLGYREDGTFLIHDAQHPPETFKCSAPPEQAGYLPATEADLGFNWGILHNNYATIAITKKLPDDRPRLTLGLPSKSVTLRLRSPNGPARAFTASEFRWDHRRREGYALASAKTGAHEGTAAHDVAWLVVGRPGEDGTGLEVANAARAGPPARATVAVAIEEAASGKVLARETRTLEVAPERIERAAFVLELDPLRAKDADVPVRFVATLTAGGVEVDRAWFDLVLARTEEKKPVLELRTREEVDPTKTVRLRFTYYEDGPATPREWPRTAEPGFMNYLPRRVVLHGKVEYEQVATGKTTRVETWERGVPTGATSWFPDGTIRAEATYTGGRLVALVERHENGKVARRQTWRPRGAEADGEVERHDPSGLLLDKGSIVDARWQVSTWTEGTRHGAWEIRKNERVSAKEPPFPLAIEEGSYDRGKKVGTWRTRTFHVVQHDKLSSERTTVYSDGVPATSEYRSYSIHTFALDRTVSTRYARDGSTVERVVEYDDRKGTVLREDEVTRDANGRESRRRIR